ncbi:ComEA family DNA-binding protein [Cellulomonas sp.]|uniref:ComEA family DNA-binding protein n=1 Tax=Cellulomonas sp. TaxID=40001 RepID=UPI0025C26CD3|nr:ComEA family DNA-binding protein [Cellulomonas sp.]
MPWRLAGAAGAVLLVVAGAVALRATATAPGEPVSLPTPAPDGPVAKGPAGERPVGAAAASGGAGTADASSGAADPEGGSGADASAAAGAPQVVVHVVGAVGAPGIVRLPAGSRVVDALASAGGATPDADLAALNLARVLVDGEQVVVPRPGEASTSTGLPPPSTGGSGLVDLNTADAVALDALPGIGPVLAQRIVEHRDERRFASVDELGDVAGIGPTLLERLRPLVRV